MKQRAGMIVGVALILAWCLLPVAWIISLSFKSQDAITNGSPGFFPADGAGAGWQNYIDVWNNEQFRRAIFNSVGISLIATALSVQEGVQMHGGIGMTDEYDIGFYMKRHRVLAELFGDAGFHADQLARAAGY